MVLTTLRACTPITCVTSILQITGPCLQPAELKAYWWLRDQTPLPGRFLDSTEPPIGGAAAAVVEAAALVMVVVVKERIVVVIVVVVEEVELEEEEEVMMQYIIRATST